MVSAKPVPIFIYVDLSSRCINACLNFFAAKPVSACRECHVNASCFNASMRTVCACNQGYSGVGTTCEDVNECANTATPACTGANEMCSNTAGSFTCLCEPGFTRDTNNACVGQYDENFLRFCLYFDRVFDDKPLKKPF